MVRALTFGTMDPNTVESGLKIKSMEEAYMNGLMAENMMVNGKTIICMVKVFIPGKTEDVMKVNTLMIENMVLVFTLGKMVDNMLAIGKMGNNMEKEPINNPMDKRRRVTGKTERGLSGLIDGTFLEIPINELLINMFIIF